MQIKTLLNKVENFKSFVLKAVSLEVIKGREALVTDIKPREKAKPECSVTYTHPQILRMRHKHYEDPVLTSITVTHRLKNGQVKSVKSFKIEIRLFTDVIAADRL